MPRMQTKPTALGFILPLMKPYKWWYLLILQATFINAFYPIVYNYAIKLLIDLFTKNNNITLDMAIYPVALFIGSNIMLEVCWRIHNLASWKIIPPIGQEIVDKIFQYVSHHSYTFYQNNLSGSIASKIKGISDGFFKIHKDLEYGLSKPLLTTIFTGIALLFASWQLFCVVLFFSLINIPVSIYCYSRLNKLEEAGQESWHHIVGLISDNIANMFTIFSFATRGREGRGMWQYFENVHKPRTFAWHKYDFWMSCLLMIINWGFMICIFLCMLYLRNIGKISTGDIAYIMSMTYLFNYNTWESLNAVKNFTQNLAKFKVSFSIMQAPQDILDKADARELVI